MTPAEQYRAPETKRGLPPDARADIYSVGVILFEMLTAVPERAGSQRADEIAEDVPEWLDAMLVKCLRKVREDRYQSIEEIFQDLKALSKGK
jgi:serine/threonine-protein kinase